MMMQRCKVTFSAAAALGAMLMLSAAASQAATIPVTGWAYTNATAANSIADAATNSPVATDARGESMAANFPAVTLADGEFIELTGSVSFSNTVTAGNQFRFALFDGDDPVTAGDGMGYVGYYASTPTATTVAANLWSANGSQANPFAAAAGTALVNFTGVAANLPADTELFFALRITRDDMLADIAASFTDGSSFNVAWAVDDTAPVPAGFNYNSVAFLMGGTLVAGTATYSDITVTTGMAIPEPASLGLLAVAVLTCIGGCARLRSRPVFAGSSAMKTTR
jgi:hypothetical protein